MTTGENTGDEAAAVPAEVSPAVSTEVSPAVSTEVPAVVPAEGSATASAEVSAAAPAEGSAAAPAEGSAEVPAAARETSPADAAVASPCDPSADRSTGEKPPGEVRVKLFARTDVGQIREHNEDNFLVADLSKRSRGLLEANRSGTVGPYGHLFAVCDGMGGAAAGEVASQLAVDIIYERMVDGLDEKPHVGRDEIARGSSAQSRRPASASSRRPRSTARAAAWAPPSRPPRWSTTTSSSRRSETLAAYILRNGIAHSGHARPVARQPAHRGRAADRRGGRDLRAQQHHPAGARHGRHRPGRPHLRADPPRRHDAALLGRAVGDGPVRRDSRDPEHGRRAGRDLQDADGAGQPGGRPRQHHGHHRRRSMAKGSVLRTRPPSLSAIR